MPGAPDDATTAPVCTALCALACLAQTPVLPTRAEARPPAPSAAPDVVMLLRAPDAPERPPRRT